MLTSFKKLLDGEWQVYFGDGVVGSALIDGNIVILVLCSN